MEVKDIQQPLEKFAKELFAKLCSPADLKVEVTPGDEDGVFYVDISAPCEDNKALVIGYRAKNLKALRTILQTYANRKFKDLNVKINLDVGDYYKNKFDRLSVRVEQAIDEVKLLKEPVKLRPMAARFRRFVHLMVSKVKGVTSFSEGEGRDRRVVIAPEEKSD